MAFNQNRLSLESWGEIIASIYEAAFDAKKWDDALKKIGEPIGCHCTDIISISSNDFVNHCYLKGMSESDVEWANQEVRDTIEAGINIKYEFSQSVKRTGYLSDRCFIAEKDMPKHPYYQSKLVKSTDTFHSGGMILENNDDRLTAIGSLRRQKAGGFQETEQAYYTMLAPHILRAIELGRIQRYTMLSLELDAQRDATLSQPGLIFLNHHGRITAMNEKALAIVKNNDGLVDREKSIAVLDFKAQKMLDDDIRNLVGSSMIDYRTQPRYISVKRPSGKPEYKMFVAPITNITDRIYGYYGAVYIFDPTTIAINRKKILKHQYNLTSTEADLAIALYQGKTLREYANSKSVSIETPRFHLKNIFLKTDTGRQAELVIKLNGLFDTNRQPLTT